MDITRYLKRQIMINTLKMAKSSQYPSSDIIDLLESYGRIKGVYRKGKFEDDRIVWYKNNVIHRDFDRPAVIYKDGSKEWGINGQLHHINGPVVIESDGEMEWRVGGNLHRIDGPAKIVPNHSE